MLRRFLLCSTHTRAVSAASFATTRVARMVDESERAKEQQLREQVLTKYRGMKIPEMTNYEYGHFATAGINAAARDQAFRNSGFGLFNTGSTSQQADGTNDQQQQSTSQTSGVMGGAGSTGQKKVDWLMLFTGVALFYFSTKILFQQLTRGVEGLNIPLWAASIEVQAKHLIYSVQFDSETKESLQKQFISVREANPFADFFSWVHSTRPEFGSGRRFSYDNAMHIMVSLLRSSDTSQLMSFARALQQALMRRGGDPQDRLDTFLDKVQGMAPMSLPPGIGGGTMNLSPSPQNTANHSSSGLMQPNSSLELNDILSSGSEGPHSSTPFQA